MKRRTLLGSAAALVAATALPAFLTTPTRLPIAITSSEGETAPPEAAAEPVSAETAEAAEQEKPKRTRRRRSPREVMDALGSESDGAAE